jgi:AraC family transcriptional regulator
VREFVEAHLAAPVRLDQMARVAGVSRGHFVRVFRRATGQSPHQYVVDRRVDFVRERLFEPRADLAALSVRAGFASHSHMTQAFRRRIGLTPSAFRALASR